MVTVDKSCYQRNALLFGQTGREAEFHQAFLPIKSANIDEYAQIAKQPTGHCWFLTNASLCSLHKEVGHKHLDVVCQTFPRYPMDTARGIDLTLSFSCPAVLKLASESTFNLVRSNHRPDSLHSTNFVTAVYPQQYSQQQPLHYYFELEQHFLDILQWRSLPMEQRIDFLSGLVDSICASKVDDLGRELTRMINADYEVLDSFGTQGQSLDESMILVENFFVNCIFKKLLYVHGLKGGADLLKLFWQQIQIAVGMETDIARKKEQAQAAILQLEFEYSHHRSRFLTRRTVGK
jgi:lysine-N-methylase